MNAIDRRQLLEQVVQRLEPHKGRRQLEVFPDSADDFVKKHLKSPVGAILVSYAGGRRGQGGEFDGPREVALDVVVLSRGLNGDQDALATVELVEVVLDNVVIIQGPYRLRLSYASDRFAGEVDRIWQYIVRITASTPR